jgi:hypothetical protein
LALDNRKKAKLLIHRGKYKKWQNKIQKISEKWPIYNVSNKIINLIYYNLKLKFNILLKNDAGGRIELKN